MAPPRPPKRLTDEQDVEIHGLYIPNVFGYRRVADKFNELHPELPDIDHSLVRSACDRVQRDIERANDAAFEGAFEGAPAGAAVPTEVGVALTPADDMETSLGKWAKSEDQLLAKSGGAALELLSTMRDTAKLIKAADSSTEKKRLAETLELISKSLNRVHESGRTIAGEPAKRTESTSTTIVVDAAKLADIAGRAKELGARTGVIDVNESTG